MNRRGFLGAFGGFIGGVATASPAALRAEAAKAMALAPPSYEWPKSRPAPSNVQVRQWAVKALARLTAGFTEADFRRKTVPTRLDADLAAMNSMSLSARLAIQKDRDVERRLDEERTYLEREIAGFWD